MSSNRPLYDMCESKQAIVESVAPGNYRLNEPRICNPCYPVDPHYRLQKIGNSLVENQSLIDVESELDGRTRRGQWTMKGTRTASS